MSSPSADTISGGWAVPVQVSEDYTDSASPSVQYSDGSICIVSEHVLVPTFYSRVLQAT